MVWNRRLHAPEQVVLLLAAQRSKFAGGPRFSLTLDAIQHSAHRCAKARILPVDVFLAAHGSFYGLRDKYETLQHRAEGDPNPFIDHAGFLAYIDRYEQRFQDMLETQLTDN